MYGLGIRVSFYLQWYSGILAAWIAPSEIPTLRIGYTFYIAATFLAVIIQVAQQRLEIIEVYIVMLLTFGGTLYLLPILIWRVLTWFNHAYDPWRFPRAKPPGKLFQALDTCLLVGVLSFQIWFWVQMVPRLKNSSCIWYGFIFYKVVLNSNVFWIFNLVVSALLLGIIVIFSVLRFYEWWNDEDDYNDSEGGDIDDNRWR